MNITNTVVGRDSIPLECRDSIPVTLNRENPVSNPTEEKKRKKRLLAPKMSAHPLYIIINNFKIEQDKFGTNCFRKARVKVAYLCKCIF